MQAPLRLIDLAQRLDVEARDFDSHVAGMVAELAGQRIAIEALPQDPRRRSDQDLARAHEQHLARCFVFVRARALDALERTGVQLPAPSGGPLASGLLRTVAGPLGHDEDAREAKHCLDELEALRALYLDELRYLVPVLIERYQGHGVERDDLLQEGFVGLLRAIDGYDWRRGVRFSTYAKYWIQERVLAALYDQSRTVRVPSWIQKIWRKVQRLRANEPGEARVASPELAAQLDLSEQRLQRVLDSRRSQHSLDSAAGDEDTAASSGQVPDPRSPADFESDRAELERSLQAALADLPEREANVLRSRYGFDGRAPKSLQELGEELGVSSERVRQIQQTALKKLQRDERLAGLFETLD